MDAVESYILDLPTPQQELFSAAHQLILELFPTIDPRVKWKIPFYHYRKKGFCYLNPQKQILQIGFPYGVLLSNHQGLLESLNLKQVRTLSIPDLKTLHQEAVTEYLLESMLIIDQQLDQSR